MSQFSNGFPSPVQPLPGMYYPITLRSTVKKVGIVHWNTNEAHYNKHPSPIENVAVNKGFSLTIRVMTCQAPPGPPPPRHYKTPCQEQPVEGAYAMAFLVEVLL